MTSIVSICNLALSNIGKDNINALSDAGAEAQACRQFYDHVRDMLLSAYVWRWAGKTVSLAEVTNDKPGEWGRAYRRPTDCLKVRWVRPEYTTTPGDLTAATSDDYGFRHDIEGDTIYTDLSPAFLHYTYRVTDPTKFPPLFVEALAWHLSVRLAMPLTRDPKVRADAYQLAGGAQATAQAADANEAREFQPDTTDLTGSRL